MKMNALLLLTDAQKNSVEHEKQHKTKDTESIIYYYSMEVNFKNKQK